MLKSILIILLVLLSFIPHNTSPRKENIVQIEQTEVSKGIFFVTPDSSYEALKYIFSLAKENICIMIYQIWHPALEDLIVNAADNGISVYIAMEDNSWNLNFAYNLSQRNTSGRIFVKIDNTEYYYHAKAICVDREILLVSSENFLPTAYPDNLPTLDQRPYNTPSRGFGAIIFDRTIAGQWEDFFLDRFNNRMIWYDGSIGEPPTDNGDTQFERSFGNLTTTNFQAELLLNPGSYEKIIDLINNAKRTIYIEAFYMSLGSSYVNQLIDALRAARARGVIVQIIIEDDWNTQYYSASETIAQLRSYGFYVAPAFDRIGDPIFLHNKAMIIDDSIVVLGSINFSGGGLNANNETGLVIYSTEVAQFFKKVFEWDWNASTTPYFDEDKDGLSYYEETDIYGTNPNSPDYDYVIVQEPQNNAYINKTSFKMRWNYWIEEKITKLEVYLDGLKIAELPSSTKELTLSDLEDQEKHHVKFVPHGIMLMRSTDVYFWVDTIPPSLEIEGLMNNSIVDSAFIIVNVSVSDLAPDTVFVYRNGELICQGIGILNISLLRGMNRLEFIAKDKAGNSNRTVFYIESTKGTIGLRIISPQDGDFITNPNVKISWNASINPDYYLIYLNGSLVANVSGNLNSYLLNITDDGLYELKIEAYIDGEIVDVQMIEFSADVYPPNIVFMTGNYTIIFGQLDVKFSVKDFSKFTLIVYVNGKKVVYRIYNGYAEKSLVVSVNGLEDVNITVIAIDEFNHVSRSFLILTNGYRMLISVTLIAIVLIFLAVLIISRVTKKK